MNISVPLFYFSAAQSKATRVVNCIDPRERLALIPRQQALLMLLPAAVFPPSRRGFLQVLVLPGAKALEPQLGVGGLPRQEQKTGQYRASLPCCCCCCCLPRTSMP